MELTKLTGTFDAPNQSTLSQAKIGAPSDSLSHSISPSIPLPGATKTCDGDDVFPPTYSDLRNSHWPDGIEWPFALDVGACDPLDEPTIRLLNTTVPICWTVRKYSCCVHYITHETADYLQRYPNAPTATDKPQYASLHTRHEFERLLGRLDDYQPAIETFLDDCRHDARPYIRQLGQWVNDIESVAHVATARYDDAVGYEHDRDADNAQITYIDERDETIEGLRAAFTRYDDVLHSIDFPQLVWDLYETTTKQTDTSTGYV